MPALTLRDAANALQRGALAEARAICETVLQHSPDDGEALFLLGAALAQSGDTRAAQPLLERARAAAPSNIAVLNALGGVYGANGEPEKAISALRAALTINPDFPWARQNLGVAFKSIGDFAAAQRNFEAALRTNSNMVEALAGLAEILLINGETEAALVHAERALALAPGQPAAQLVKAEAALRRREPQETLSLVGQRREEPKALALRGRACEALERYEDAFEAFAAANRIQHEQHRAAFESDSGILAPTTVAALTEFMRTTDAAAWTKPEDPAQAPTFLIGFPRSGTTLLDQVLSSHPEIDTLEESQNFTDAFGPLVLAPGALRRWDTITAGELQRFRQLYWRRVRAAFGDGQQGSVLIDKMPLNTILLPLIHLLFPEARIIFALRDSRDVALSCFTQQFQMNAAMFQFLTLETTARYYAAVMRLGEIARERLPLRLHVLRYEDLLADFDATVEALLRFLGLPWDDSVRRYRETAGGRLIRTPSAEQVRQPLYQTSVARWRRYERQLAPVLPLLEEWARKFGYG